MDEKLEILKNNLNFSRWGGRRTGAGRKSGISKANTIKRQLSDFVNDRELEGLVAKAKEIGMEGQKDMLKYLIDQCLGKPTQKVILEQIDRSALTEDQVWLGRVAEEVDKKIRQEYVDQASI